MNLILLIISSFFVPYFVGNCIENVNSNSATIFNNNHSRLSEVIECNEIQQQHQIIGTEKPMGQTRFKRSGRFSIGKLTNSGRRSIGNGMNSLRNRARRRNSAPGILSPTVPNSNANFYIAPNAPPIMDSLRTQMAPRQRIGQTSSSPTAFSKELGQKASQFRSREGQIDRKLRFIKEMDEVNKRYEMARQRNANENIHSGQLNPPRKYGKYLAQIDQETRREKLQFAGLNIPEPPSPSIKQRKQALPPLPPLLKERLRDHPRDFMRCRGPRLCI